jgi:hypothetical protein
MPRRMHRTTLQSFAAVTTLGLAASAGLAHAGLAHESLTQDSSVGLTIYSSAQPGAVPVEMYRPVPPSMGGGWQRWNVSQIPGYALVRQGRSMDLDAGRGTVKFTDVAALLEPTTVRFESLTHPGTTRVLEQNFQFDLLGIERMLERSIDQTISVDGQDVTLLSVTNGGILAQRPSGDIFFQQGYQDLSFDAPEGGFITKPTLVWDLAADHGGAHDVRISYETQGITWWADYNLVWTPGDDENSGTIDISAWVSILNKSGATYVDAALKLIAGDVQRAPQPGRGGRFQPETMMMARSAMADDGGFEEKSFFEYHLYTLSRPTTVPDRSTKQVELFAPVANVPAEKLLVFDSIPNARFWGYGGSANTNRGFGQGESPKVDVFVKFTNAEDDGMGMPLPAGRMRVSQRDTADDSLEFIGENVIDHTPREEEILIKLGSAFDVVGERVQTDFQYSDRRNEIVESFEVTLRNRKDAPVDVLVREVLYRWSGWEITRASDDWTKEDSRTIHIPVTLEPDEERTITYTVRYRWE